MFNKSSVKRRFCAPVVGAVAAAALSIPSLAVDSTAGVLDPTVFDPMVSSVTGNVSALLPSVIVVVGLVTAIGIVIALFKRHSQPGGG